MASVFHIPIESGQLNIATVSGDMHSFSPALQSISRLSLHEKFFFHVLEMRRQLGKELRAYVLRVRALVV